MIKPPHRLRIDFQVREILPEDGSVGADPRYITFGDDVEIHNIRDFFDRCGIAADLMFKGCLGSQAIVIAGTIINKIGAIKVIRMLTGVGLKDAKDAIERAIMGGNGSPIIVFENGVDVEAGLNEFRLSGIHEVTQRAASFADMLAAGVLTYKSK